MNLAVPRFKQGRFYPGDIDTLSFTRIQTAFTPDKTMSYVTFLDKKRLGGGPLAVAKYHALMNPGALIFGPDGKVVDIDPSGALIRGPDGKIVDLDPTKLAPEIAAALVRDHTGRIVDIDPARLPGTILLYDALNPESRGPGRPKLGVTAREVTLLPRHWEWLAAQPGGASVALRKLVEAASRDPKAERVAARDAAYRFASAMGGDEAGFEEAMRALYAGKRKKFRRQLETWPPDVRAHLEKMAAPVFDDED
jgi:uncharacterized protein